MKAACVPPSTGIVVPVTYDASFDKRNSITFAISDGSAILPRGEGPEGLQFPWRWGVFFSLTIGVFTVPGAMAFTVIPYFAHSTESTLVS